MTAAAIDRLGHRRTRVFWLYTALVAALLFPTVVPAAANPGDECRMRAGTIETLSVPSGMGPIPVQVQWARHCGPGALYLLDGLRAGAVNGWFANTDAVSMFADDDLTVVMPAGGPGSWYADWAGPTAEHGRVLTYRWETFLTDELPGFLAGFGVGPDRYAVVGLSMSASSALVLAAHHRSQFRAAAAFSGILDWHSPDMREAVRAATWQAGHDPDRMAVPGSPAWDHLDPVTAAPLLAGLPLYLAASPGLPSPGDRIDSLSAAADTVGAMALEAVTAVSTHRFKQRLDGLGIGAVYDFPPTGTHTWSTWQADLARARPYLLEALAEDGQPAPR
ncbi:alpha/beta hydrolase family protein [Nocardia sp. XZ_19_369]|uniref:alpha/beta hydrolase n=1 Tax=Nocardia sp. XZ_19_369 TaxID=2769487 RepID=UPI0018907F0B|nr:alpha/beta hydrolase family protein [Nocardia sp. XZ_19_369]